MNRNRQSFPRKGLFFGLISLFLVDIIVLFVVFFSSGMQQHQAGAVTPTVRSGVPSPSSHGGNAAVDMTSITTLELLQGALANARGQQAQLLQSIVNQVGAYPPASEPALVTMLQALVGSGNAPPFFEIAPIPGRDTNWVSSMSTVDAPGNYQALNSSVISPLILDMSGTGIPDVANHEVNPHPFTFSRVHTTLFDMNADGYPDFTEWVGSEAALLVHPLPADMVSNNKGQLIWKGPITGANLIGTAGGYQNGFEHLSTFDTNGDGLIDGNELHQLYAWIDSNGNGNIDPGELHTLQSLGIQSLAVQHNGNTGSYVKNGKTLRMWDWWPTFIEVIPSLAQSLPSQLPTPTCTETTVNFQGRLTSPQAPDLRATLSSQKTDTGWSIPIASLEHFGFQPNSSMLAHIAPAGNTLALIDYRAQLPHTARVWLLTAGKANTWLLMRFALPQSSIEQVSFNASGDSLFLLTQNQTQPYVIRGLATAASSTGPSPALYPTLSSLRWNSAGAGFRVLWGALFSQGEDYYIPGYFHTASGIPLCESLAQLSISGEDVSLHPFSDIHWLNGDELPAHGYSPPFLNFIVSPDLSYAAVKNLDGSVSLLAITGQQASGGKVILLDTMNAIGGLSASSSSIEYLARQANGVWEVRWIDLANQGQSDRVALPLTGLPAYPELTANGTQAIWGVFDWSHGTVTLWSLHASSRNAKPQRLFSFNSMIGAIRVANAATMAVQTAGSIIVWSAAP